MYKLSDIAYETHDFWVLSVGARGYEVMRKGATGSYRVASIGNGPAPRLGIERAKAEADRRQAEIDAAIPPKTYYS